MPETYLAITTTDTNAVTYVLLAQQNLYQSPCPKYPFAMIAHHAVNYVLPGGQFDPADETPAAGAVRELQENTNVQLQEKDLTLLMNDNDVWAFTAAVNADSIKPDDINALIESGGVTARKINNVCWTTLEDAFGRLGNKPEYQILPWVTNQIVTALNAGFTKEMINENANESHLFFAQALAHLLLDNTSNEPAPEKKAS
ncbi:MAG TPA: NUDIX domain-containing protein [bacterium]|nr:NUDIX domain-containing protein [bacterium]